MRISAQNPSVNVCFGRRAVSRNRLLCVCAVRPVQDHRAPLIFPQINICTQTRIFPSFSQVLVLFQLGKTWRIARERSCLCRFSYKHRNVFSFQLFHGIGPAACLDKPFLIALIQAKETQHLHRLVCFRLVFSVVFHVGKRGMLVLDAACLSWLGEFSLVQSLISDRSHVFSVCGNGFVLAGP